MSQKQRIEIPGAIYYVKLKSSGHRELFSEQQECVQAKYILGQLQKESGGGILGYCLLLDSIHLVLRSAENGDGSSQAMGLWLIERYTDYFNSLHRHSGHIFHNHFPTTLIDPNHYLLPVIYQLHQLPVTLGMVPKAGAYPWSSHRDYLSVEPLPWLDRSEVFRRIGQHRATQVRRYELFIEEHHQDKLDWDNGNHPRYRALASDDYISRLINAHRQQQTLPTVSLESLLGWVCTEYSLSPQDLVLWRRHRLIHEVRAVVAALAIRIDCADLAEIAEFFACDADMLENGMRALESHRSMYMHRLQLELTSQLQQLGREKRMARDTPATDSYGEDGESFAEDREPFHSSLEQNISAPMNWE